MCAIATRQLVNMEKNGGKKGLVIISFLLLLFYAFMQQTVPLWGLEENGTNYLNSNYLTKCLSHLLDHLFVIVN